MLKQSTTVLRLARFYFKQIWQEAPFIIVTISGVGLLITLILTAKGFFGAPVLPSTYTVLDAIRQLEVGLVALAVLYTGEIYWKDRQFNVQSLTDCLPLNNYVRLLSQVMALLLVMVSLFLLLLFVGITLQVSQGFTDLNLKLYFGTIFTELLLNQLLIIVLSLFVHSLFNKKLIANFFIILLLMANNYFPNWGLEHQLYQFASLRLGTFSDLNGYLKHELKAFPYYALYWAGFVTILFQLASLLTVRGTDTYFPTRLKLVVKRFDKNALKIFLSGIVLFTVAGGIIQYNTTSLNEFKTRRERNQHQALYEKKLKKFDTIEIPEITSIAFNIDLFPSTRTYTMEGTYSLINSTEEPIKQLYVQSSSHPKIIIDRVSFGRSFHRKDTFPEFQFSIYELDEVLAVGDTMSMTFSQTYSTQGFAQDESYSVYENGTFFTNGHLPKLSYNSNLELEGTTLRTRFGLKQKERLKDSEDSTGYSIGSNYAHNISFDATISTAADQEAATSGYLIKQWQENGRNYFHYKSAQPIENQYVILSGKYASLKDTVIVDQDTIEISINHHPKHAYNLKDMLTSMKASLKYCNAQLSKYQYKTLNIYEIPRYLDFAMSVPNTIAFSEGVGFMMKNKAGEINMSFYVTAHETAHQWWGDRVRGAEVKGRAMVTETLAQYIAAVVTIHTLGEESLIKVLDHERERYLAGRKNEKQIEQPLAKSESQSYIHYGKGLINMMALRHYISEDSVNSALRRVIQKFPASQGKYPNSGHVISEFRQSTPDSLQYLITDLFEQITFFENKIHNGQLEAVDENNYRLQVDVLTPKFQASPEGLQNSIQTNDWIEIGVYGQNERGEEELMYRKMHFFNQAETRLEISLNQIPSKVVIDPSYLLMDRNLDDNEWEFK